MLTVGSLFAGIGGFDLGFERAGFEILWQVEIDPFCRRVLAKHWPDVVCYQDVCSVHFSESCLEDGCGTCLSQVDVLCAGFPCQPVCHHGNRRGRADDRWLWPEVARLVGELEPGYVVLENVSGILHPGRGFSEVIADLASLGYDAEWECLSATSVGAPHYRERVWLVAYRPDDGRDDGAASRIYVQWPQRDHVDGCGSYPPRRDAGAAAWRTYAQSNGPQPGILREAYGISGGLDRVFALGNSIVPQIAQWIAERILTAEGLKQGG
jgi:DNA (cytosine-5)-methyltransferase 1